MATRRGFVGGMVAAMLAPKPTWADVGRPAFLSAAKGAGGGHLLCGLTANGQIVFERPLPARGHAAAAHPVRPEVVAFARRPGTYALVLDCRNGQGVAHLNAPEGRHFYGHGTFSADGEFLFTTENDFGAARGMVGIWDVRNGYARIGEFASGGVGPHDVRLLPDAETLVVANGGIETHPETGRAKLNLPSMTSNLSYLRLDGRVLAQVELPPEHQRNSIRHLAVAPDGTVAFAMQWQGDLTSDLPLLGMHNLRTDELTFAPEVTVRNMNGYLGSVAVSADGTRLAATSPRRGRLTVVEAKSLTLVEDQAIQDVSGVSFVGEGLVTTSGTGALAIGSQARQHPLQWDNHLVALGQGPAV